ncbi:TIGR02444 family protein [Hyphobacterium sp. HN65]|uniref:TIGR02444 family protein n=1 Tax=Hyphobacterium lacteum TaxID=3116575 RepID=A0ABU7LNX8_9PROT|nr:TIGR02444 family protein [Hyphobacterium sp. HN65]MEE2525610.1 TIGR02444 family protein [Hyphobacterium sp. HN65]
MSHAFWDWSLEVYDQPAMREACLSLQDTHGLNVNICLWCAWLAQEGRDPRGLLPDAIERLEPWSADITRAIRKVRRQLKDAGGNPQLYKAILACELDAEHIEQDLLFELSETAPPAGDAESLAAAALGDYARLAGVNADFTEFLESVFLGVKKV